MSTPTDSPRHDLPPYLGLGVLDAASVRAVDDEVTDNYLYNSQVIFEVTLLEGGCRIIEYLNH